MTGACRHTGQVNPLIRRVLEKYTVTLLGSVTLAQLEQLYRSDDACVLTRATFLQWNVQLELVAQTCGQTCSGVNAEFIGLQTRSAPKDADNLQYSLILSHCCGVGEPLDENVSVW